MTRPLAEVVRDWPHEKWLGDGYTDSCMSDCRRCAIEKWMREWREHYLLRARRREMTTCEFIVKDVLGAEADDGK